MALTHWNARCADDNLHAGNSDHRALGATGNDPVVGAVCQSKAENVLEDDHASEAFDGEITVGVNNVEGAGHSANYHASDLKTEEDKRYAVVEFLADKSCRGDTEAVQADAPNDEHWEHHDDAELRLVDAIVAPSHELGAPVGEDTCNNESHESSDESTHVGVTGVHLIPVVRGSEENGGNDDSDEDRPTDHGSLNEAAPEEGWLSEQWKRAQKQFPVAFISFAAIKETERLHKRLLGNVCAIVGGHARHKRRRIGRILVMTVVHIQILHLVVTGVDYHVGVESSVATIGRLGAQEEDGRQHDGAEDGFQVEGPPPADAVGNFPNDDGCEEGTAENGQVGEGHARATLMYEVQIADSSVDKGLERSTADALDDTGAKERVVVGADGAGPGGRPDEDAYSQDEKMALPPYTS